MSNHFLAYECLHPIYSASFFPVSDNPIDFSTPYCDACIAKRREQEATDAHEQLLAQDHSREQRKESRSRVSRAHLETLERTSPDSEAVRRTEGRLENGVKLLDTPTKSGARPSHLALPSKTARFANQQHRAEEDVRDQLEYKTTSSQYVPGAWADQTGEGHENTSDPNGETAKEEAEEAAKQKQWEEDMEEMSDEAFEEYCRENKEVREWEREMGKDAEEEEEE